MKKKILIGQLNSNGDILLATTIAKQIKEIDFKGCHLTWAVGSYCLPMLIGNPYIDEIWEIKLEDKNESEQVWCSFFSEAVKRKNKGIYDEIFFTQIVDDERKSIYNGSLRGLVFKGYPKKITIPVIPVLRLNEREIENVKQFVHINNINDFKIRILFECSPLSGQFNMTPQIAKDIANKIIKSHPDVCFILSCPDKICSQSKNIIGSSPLTIRENAELTKYCDLLLGCSSGISWISTSDYAKHIPMIQLINVHAPFVQSFILDHKKFKLNYSEILELYNPSLEAIHTVVSHFLNNGFKKTKEKYQKKTRIPFHNFKYYYTRYLQERSLKKIFRILKYNFAVYFFNFRFWNIFISISINIFFGWISCRLKRIFGFTKTL